MTILCMRFDSPGLSMCVCVLSVMIVEVMLLVRGSCGQHRTGLGGATASWA